MLNSPLFSKDKLSINSADVQIYNQTIRDGKQRKQRNFENILHTSKMYTKILDFL